MEFEDILLEVGDYGKYQRNLILIFLVPAASLLPWFSMNILFMVSAPDHWCYVPEVAASNLSISVQRSLISPPDSPSCYMYDINYTEYLSAGIYKVPNDTTTRPCNQGWQYDKTDFESTAVTQWDLVCNDDHYKSFILTMFNVGSIIGTPIYGALSDRIGRKITFFITILVTAVTAIASVLMTNFTAFVVIKTINGSLMPSVFQLPYIIILEIVSPEMRTRMNGIVNCAWTFGLCFLPLIAYLSRSWVILGVITSSVTVIYLLYWKYLPESPRWLVSQERYDEAVVIMQRIGKKNKKVEDKSVLLNKLQKLGEKIKKEKQVDGVKNSSSDLLKYPQLRKKFIIITFCWMADIMAYYGLQLNVSNLAGNEFINFFLLALVEIPGYLTSWVFMERIGRRWCTVGGFILTGLICMLPSVEFPYGDVVCSLIGKFFAAATFMATYQQSSELYPTVVRSLGMGMSSTVAFVATLIVPYLVYLSVYGKAIPFLIIGMSCVIAGIMASFLPETLNENLPQTIFDAEEFGKHQKFFSCNRRRRSLSRERAASLIKVKALENILSCDEKDANLHQAVTVLQNSDLIPNGDSYVAMTEPEKILKDKSDSLRNRKNSQYIAKDLPTGAAQFPVNSSDSNEGHTDTSELSQKDQHDANLREELKETIPTENEELKEKSKLPVDAPTDNKPFAYVNAVFDNKEEDSQHTNEQSECKQNISPTGTLEKKGDLSAPDTKMKIPPAESHPESH